MSGIETVSASSAAFSVGGRELQFSPLRTRDIGYWIQWCRSQVISAGRDSIKDSGLSDRDKVLVLQAAHEAASRIKFDGENEMLSDPSGAVKLIWLSARGEHPEITEDEIDHLIGPVGGTAGAASPLELVLKHVLTLSGCKLTDKAPPPGKP